MIIDGTILVGLFRLRRTGAHYDRPYAVPWYPWLPGVTLAAFIGLLVIILFTQPAIVLGGMAILATLTVCARVWLHLAQGEAA